jgi:C4-type Zn-finger protein
LLKNISEHLKCPNCGSAYDATNVHYLGRIQVFYVLQLFCERCGIPVFASVLIKDGRKSGVKQLFSELSKQDLLRISPDPVAADEVLDFQSFLKNYKGSLSDLIK